MTALKWIIAGLVLAIGLFGAGYLVEHHRDAVAGQLRQQHADSLLAAQRRATDTLRLRAVADSVEAADANQRASEAAAVAQSYRQAAAVASGTAKAALARLDSLRTAGDSLADYRDRVVPALLLAHQQDTLAIDALTVAHVADSTAYQRQLAATAQLESIVRSDSTLIRSLRDSLGTPVPAPIVTGFGQKALSTGETLAFGAATVGSCRQSLLSVGCIAGAAATVVRVRPWKL